MTKETRALYKTPELPHHDNVYWFRWSDTEVKAEGYVAHHDQVWKLSEDGDLRPMLLAVTCNKRFATKLANMLNWCKTYINKEFHE